MTRFIALLALSTILTACPGPDDTGDTDDTGTDPDAVGSILGILEVDGVDVDVQFQATNPTDPEDSYAGTTGFPLEVPVGSWIVTAGSDPKTADQLPTIVVDDLPWVAPPPEVDVSKNTESPATLIANRYMENPSLTCHADGIDWDEGQIYVKNGYKLELTKTLGNGSWLKVDVDKLVMAGQMASAGVQITSSNIGIDSLTFTTNNGSFTVDYTCN